jgi:hypothetical protein
MVAYKAELNQRYWEYQKSQFPVWQNFFDQPQSQGVLPLVVKSKTRSLELTDL